MRAPEQAKHDPHRTEDDEVGCHGATVVFWLSCVAPPSIKPRTTLSGVGAVTEARLAASSPAAPISIPSMVHGGCWPREPVPALDATDVLVVTSELVINGVFHDGGDLIRVRAEGGTGDAKARLSLQP
jgi:hypothetical protein